MWALRPLVAGSVLAMLVAAPVAAAPPQTVELSNFHAFPDPENDLVVFWNITRDDTCAWIESGFVGPAPVEEPITWQIVPTGNDVLVALAKATRSIELWQLDPGASAPIDVCADTDAQAAPWATGTAHVVRNDNDLTVSLTRTNAFGDRAQGMVTDIAGNAWRYGWVWKGLESEKQGFRVVSEHYFLQPIGR